MSALFPASEVILRHLDEFNAKHVLFAGDLQDTLATQFVALNVYAHTQQYHHWQILNRTMGAQAQFGLMVDSALVKQCDTLIYYWPKSKQEAQFQLSHLLSLLAIGTDIFIVGENRSGVRSVEKMLSADIKLNKIDSARRCSLFYGQLSQSMSFNFAQWWHQYQFQGLQIKTLPGVFSHDGLDHGSALLLSTLEPNMQGNVLDIGCGSGVLAAALAKHSPQVRLTLSDVNAAALASSQATLAANNIAGEVIASNVYSEISGRFDFILSNPPFHDGLQTSLTAARSLIQDSVKYLHKGGQLRIVANAFLPYAEILEETFGHYQVLAQTGRFKVYQAILSQ